MTRAITCAIALSVLTSNTALADTTAKIEIRALTTGAADRPALGINGLVEHTFTPKLKLWAWVQVEETWAEGYVGAAYSPLSWLEFGGAVGIEQDKNPWRVGGYVWMGNKYVSFLALVEDGGSGPWYIGTILGKPVQWFEFGAMIRRFTGLGPRIDFSLPFDPKLKLWVAYLPYEPESNSVDHKRTLMGLSYRF